VTTFENQFLAANKANKDYKKKTITLNTNIKTRIIHKKPLTESNEKYIIKSGTTIKANKDIYNTTYNHSSGHIISNNIQYKIESFKQTQHIELTTSEKSTRY